MQFVELHHSRRKAKYELPTDKAATRIACYVKLIKDLSRKVKIPISINITHLLT